AHTPVSAGNETYGRDVFRQMLGGVGNLIGDPERLVSLGCIHGDDRNEPPGMTPIAIRASRSTNAVSRRHGEVARDMWRPLFEPGADVPIDHVTIGVHIPTWMKGPMRCLLDRHLGADWWSRAGDPATWNAMDGIPDAELWAARGEQRAALVEFVRRRATGDRLRRGEDRPYIEAAEHGFDPDRLTVAFARRSATYKRLHPV